jgi:hypothetical protein
MRGIARVSRFQRCNRRVQMIFSDPTEEQLRAAHVITFFDPQRPEFHFIVVDEVDRSNLTPKDLLVIDIPIDSTHAETSEKWLDLIARARSTRGARQRTDVL